MRIAVENPAGKAAPVGIRQITLGIVSFAVNKGSHGDILIRYTILYETLFNFTKRLVTSLNHCIISPFNLTLTWHNFLK